MYTYSCKEILFILKYRREGLAYEIWRNGTMTRASRGKDFPSKVESAIPELFEKQTVDLSKLPPEFKKQYIKNMQKELDKRYANM